MLDFALTNLLICNILGSGMMLIRSFTQAGCTVSYMYMPWWFKLKISAESYFLKASFFEALSFFGFYGIVILRVTRLVAKPTYP